MTALILKQVYNLGRWVPKAIIELEDVTGIHITGHETGELYGVSVYTKDGMAHGADADLTVVLARLPINDETAKILDSIKVTFTGSQRGDSGYLHGVMKKVKRVRPASHFALGMHDRSLR